MFRLCFVLTLCIYGVLAALEDFDEWQYDVDRPSENNAGGDSKCRIDLLLLVDTSASIKKDAFAKMTEFLKKFVMDPRLNVGPEGTKIGLILFSSKDKTEVKLTMGEKTDAQQLGNYISNLQWKDVVGGQTRTEMALNLSKEIFSENSPHNYRSSVDDVVVLITDGDPIGDAFTVNRTKKYAQDLKDREIVFITAGVGPESEKKEFKEFLEGLATSPDYCFKAMFSEMDEILEKLVNKSCSEPVLCACDGIIEGTFSVKPGQEKAMARWREPTPKCATGGKVIIGHPVVDPPFTSPHAFAPGPHVINYKYNPEGGVPFSCQVKIDVKGELCGGKPFNCARQVCCCGAVHTRRSGYACCGTAYFDTSLQKCCTNANLISQNELCP